jgi:hypothetical protein
MSRDPDLIDGNKNDADSVPSPLSQKQHLTIGEMLSEPHSKALPQPSSIQPQLLTWFKTGEQLLESKHPRAQSLASVAISLPSHPTTSPSLYARAPAANAILSQASTAPPRVKVDAPAPSLGLQTAQHKQINIREKQTIAPLSRDPAMESSYGPNFGHPPVARSATRPSYNPTQQPSMGYDIVFANPQHQYIAPCPQHRPRVVPVNSHMRQQQPQYRYTQSVEQRPSPERPTTPHGTAIHLPANAEVARRCGLEIDGRIDVQRLARWAKYNSDWAEYLRDGGGDDETWWLYRHMAGFPGHKVSVWHKVYDERKRQADLAVSSELCLLDGLARLNNAPPAPRRMTSDERLSELLKAAMQQSGT